MRCNNAQFASYGVSSFGVSCSTLSFSTPGICVIEFCRCFDKPPLAKRVCMLGFTSAFHKLPPKFKTVYILFSVAYNINSLAVYTSHVKHV